MIKHYYGEIPDDYRSKEYLLLCPHIFRCFRELGLEYIERVYPKYQKILPEATQYRFSNMIFTSKEIVEGKILPDMAEKIILYTIPHVMSVRADLQMGLQKLLFGDSTDISFLILDDKTNELFHVTNLHSENGIPVDWWVVNHGDELLNRRHMKHGIRLKDIPKKTSNYLKATKMVRELLLDIRNERTPQFSHSMYSLSTVNSSMMFNLFAELSNYEIFNTIWMGMNSKRVYKMPDQLFTLYPSPPLIGTLTYLSMREWTSKLVGLASGRRLVLHQVEDLAIDWIKEEFPEILPMVLLDQWKAGIPNPGMTMGCDIPDKKEKLLDQTGNLVRHYPQGQRLTLEDLEIPEEEAFKGYLTNITDENLLDLLISKKNLISQNMGRFTKFF